MKLQRFNKTVGGYNKDKRGCSKGYIWTEVEKYG